MAHCHLFPAWVLTYFKRFRCDQSHPFIQGLNFFGIAEVNWLKVFEWAPFSETSRFQLLKIGQEMESLFHEVPMEPKFLLETLTWNYSDDPRLKIRQDLTYGYLFRWLHDIAGALLHQKLRPFDLTTLSRSTQKEAFSTSSVESTWGMCSSLWPDIDFRHPIGSLDASSWHSFHRMPSPCRDPPRGSVPESKNSNFRSSKITKLSNCCALKLSWMPKNINELEHFYLI